MSQLPIHVTTGAQSASVNAVTPATPTHVRDDILWLHIETLGITPTLSSNTAGYQRVPGFPLIVGTPGSAGAVCFDLWWVRAADNATASPTVADSGDHQIARINSTRYARQTGTPWLDDDDDIEVGTLDPGDTAVSIPGLTTSVDNCLIMQGVAGCVDTGTSQTGSWTNGDLTTLTERWETYDASGAGGGMAVATGWKPTAGAIGATTATLTTSTLQAFYTIAVAPRESIGLAGAGAVGTNSLAVPYPSDLQAGDELLLKVASKVPGTADVATPSGYTLIANAESTSEPGTDGTNDQGDAEIWVYQKDGGATGLESGTLAVTVTSGNACTGQFVRYRPDPGYYFDVDAVAVAQDTPNVPWSAVAGSDPGFEEGDIVLCASAINTDTPARFASGSLTIPGCVVSEINPIDLVGTVNGADVELVTCDAEVESGTSSGAPTLTFVLNSNPGTNVYVGGTAFIRLRPVAGGGVDHELDGSIDGAGSLAGSLDVDRVLAGTAAGAGALGGSVQVDRDLGGAMAGAGTLAGSVDVDRDLGGAVSGAGALAGAATMDRALAGAVAGVGALSGFVLVDWYLSGSIAGVAVLAGSFEPDAPPAPPAFSEFTSTVDIADRTPTLLAINDNPSALEILTMYVTKAGDRLPGIAGTITVPFGIDITGLTLYMTMKGRDTGEVQTIAIGTATLSEDSPALDNADELPTIWDWSHAWASGETDTADRYKLGISTEVAGKQITFPNDQWEEFVIQAQLAEDPVP